MHNSGSEKAPRSKTDHKISIFYYCDLGGPNLYLLMKFGRNRLINKNFTAREMSKNVIFLTFFRIAPLSDPFSRYFDFPYVERHKHYFRIKFGRNPLVKKNVRVPGVSKNRKFPLFARSDPFLSTSHRRHRGRAPDYLHINFGENRLVNKNFSFLGVERTPFSEYLHQRLQGHPIGYPCTRIDKIRQGNSQVTTFYSIQSYHAGFRILY
jgi:hypothetical protein